MAARPPPPDPDGPHNLPPGQQVRCTVQGKLLVGGGTCTVILIRDQERHAWVLYPHGAAGMGIRISDRDGREFAGCMLTQGGRT